MKLPMVFVQLCSQPPFAVLHSLMSMKQQGIEFFLLEGSNSLTKQSWDKTPYGERMSHATLSELRQELAVKDS